MIVLKGGRGKGGYQEVSGSSCTFHGSVLEKDTSEPKPSTGETHGIHEYESFGCDMTEMILKLALKTIQSVN